MKLQPDKFDVQTVSGHGSGWIALNGEKRNTSVIISSEGQRIDWPVNRFEDLTAAHFAQLDSLVGELVVFGSGSRLRFVPPAWLQGLMKRRIGIETMDTAAACRTYNILAGEGRVVIAALVVEQAL